MLPFKVSEAAMMLVWPFPSANTLRDAGRGMASIEVECIMRQWVSEGIPYAFKDIPMVYEQMRGWLGNGLGISPKEITVVGSARMGYSLAPVPEYGRSFGLHSDLDISVVSGSIFEGLRKDFQLWSVDFQGGVIQPRDEREKNFWIDNAERVPINLLRGFIDAKKIPNFRRYGCTQRLANLMYVLKCKLDGTAGAPRIKRASVRAYKDWNAFIGQAKRSWHTVVVSWGNGRHRE